MQSSRSQRMLLWGTLMCCLLKGGLIAAVTPPFQTPDEYGHYDYVLYLSHIRWGAFLRGDIAKPVGYNDVTTEELWAVTRATGTESHLRGPGLVKPLPSFRGQLAAGHGFVPSDTHEQLRTKVIVAAQFNYPVLYYGSSASLVQLVRVFTANPVTAYYVVRSASLLLGLLTVYLVWCIGVLLYGPHSWLPVAAATMFNPLQPQHGMLGTSVQSDVLTIALVTLAGTVATSYAAVPTRSQARWMGVVIGLLLLTKVHAAASVAVAVAALICWRRRSEGMAAIAADVVPAAALAAGVGLWWYVRSYFLYGSATGMVGDFKTAQFAGSRQNIKVWLAQWRLTVESFWGMWGWLEVPLPRGYYSVLAWLSGFSTLAASGAFLRRSPLRAPSPAMVFWATLTLAYAVIMLGVAALVGPVHNNQGRHWLPLVAVPALLFAAAVAYLHERSSLLAQLLLVVWCVVLAAANIRLALSTSAFYGGYGL